MLPRWSRRARHVAWPGQCWPMLRRGVQHKLCRHLLGPKVHQVVGGAALPHVEVVLCKVANLGDGGGWGWAARGGGNAR
jgi:hypothetical protein